MIDTTVNVLVLIACLFMLLAAVGVVRMPDLYMRMSTVTKSATMGAGLLLLAVVLHDGSLSTIVKALMVAVFGFLTSPISGHMVARAAYLRGVPLWDQSVVDELKGHYEQDTDRLESPAPEEELVVEGHAPEDI